VTNTLVAHTARETHSGQRKTIEKGTVSGMLFYY
jgi:hypothetical protein